MLFANGAAIVTDAIRKGRIGLGLGVNQIALAVGFMLGPVVGGILTAISWHGVPCECSLGHRWNCLGNTQAARAGLFAYKTAL